MKISITAKGLDKLTKMLLGDERKQRLQQEVRTYAVELQRATQAHAVFRGHYEWRKGAGLTFVKSTGQTRRSIELSIAADGLSATVGTVQHYAPYLEYGTRFMEAQPFMKPAIEEVQPRFITAVKKAMEA